MSDQMHQMNPDAIDPFIAELVEDGLLLNQTIATFPNTEGPFIRPGMMAGQGCTTFRLALLYDDTDAILYAAYENTREPDRTYRPVGATDAFVQSDDWNEIIHQFNPHATGAGFKPIGDPK